MTANQSKLIFFDLDGTLIDGCEFIFSHLWEYFELDRSVNRKHIEDFNAGRLSYDDWVKVDIEIFRAAGVTKAKMLRAFKGIHATVGALEVLRHLKSKGHKIFVLSGGIDLVVHHIFPDWQNIFEDVFINKYVFDEAGVLVDAVPTRYDFEHKATCIKDMVKKHGADISQTVFVGDNHNDVQAAIVAGTSVAFNCKSDQLVEVANHHVESNDLRDVLKFV